MSAARGLALALAAALCAAGAAHAEERTARIAAGGCTVALEEREHGAVLTLRPGCALDLAETLRALGALLAELYPDRRLPPAVQSLLLGRIEALPWLSERVAETARNDPGWNAKTGRPKERSRELWVTDALRRHELARELVRLLETFGVSAEPCCAEKVLIRTGVDPGLPYDAVVWLRFAPR